MKEDSLRCNLTICAYPDKNLAILSSTPFQFTLYHRILQQALSMLVVNK